MYHHGHSSNCSTFFNSNKNDVDNITSIIDSFENGNYKEICGPNLGCLLGVNIKQELDNVLLRLDSELIPCVLNDAKTFGRKDLQECFEKIRLIKQKFSKLYKFLKVNKRNNYRGNYNFVCSTCKEVIPRAGTGLSDIWCNLEQHDHFNGAFLNLLTSDEILDNHSNCIDNICTDVSLIMTAIPKSYELSTSDIGSISSTVSDNSLNDNISSTDSTLQAKMIPKKVLDCKNCGLQRNYISDFKFNFKIMYSPLIEQKMYCPRFVFPYLKEQVDEVGEPFLQFKGKQLFTCLLCNCDVPSYIDYSVIYQHIQGNRHIRKKSTPTIIQSLLAYHENWRQLEPNYQAHQTYFLPLSTVTLLCVPCGRKGTIVSYEFLENHINSEKHKESFWRSCAVTKSRRLFDCLLQLQGKVYANKDEIASVCPNDCKENGFENEAEKKKSVRNCNESVSTIKIEKTYYTKEQYKNNLIESNNIEGLQATNYSSTPASVISKEEKHVTLESDIDARVNQRRAESMVNNSDIPLNNEINSKPDDSLSKDKPLKHIIVKSVANHAGTELHELLEHRFLPHLKCFLTNGLHIVKCKTCNTTMTYNLKLIRDHISTKEHEYNSKIITPTYQFYCGICNVTIRRSKTWEDHLKQQKHIERYERLTTSRKNNVTEFECETCKLVIFGDDLSIKRHLTSAGKGGRYSKVKEIVLSPEVKNLFKSQQYIQERSLLLVKEANKVLLNQEPVKNCCQALETALADVYPDCKVYPFGSRVSGLGNERSDLDVFVDMGDMYMGQNKQDSRNQEKFVITACKIFRKKKEEFSHINPIPTARTPIVQVYHIPSKLDCDLSFRHGLSVENTKFLRLCIDLQPITQSLILILKQWVEYCKLQEHITTYALCMMVIFHLQVGGYLMPVHKLRQLNPDNVFVIDGWGVVEFSKSIANLREHIVPYHGSVAEMLKELFYYYSKFNYATDVICPLLGYPIKKALFLDNLNGENLPLEMLAYVLKVSSTDAEYFRARSPFCIQDPFDLSHNLVKACNLVVVDKFKTFCDLTLKHFSNIC